jgi:peptide/nickel transport system permease protein
VSVEPAVTARKRRPRAHPLLRFVGWRILAGIATLLAVSVLVFVGTEVLPGDAAGAVLGRNATPEQLDELREQMNLDRPAVVRYLEWLGGLVRGDLGNSAAGYAEGSVRPIGDEISGAIVNSLALALVTALFMVPLGLLFGVWAGIRAGRATDHAISTSSLTIVSLPEFVLGSLLILVFFSWLGWLSPLALIPPHSNPLADPQKLVLPVLTLLGASLASSIRMVRAGMVQALGTDYVRMARLNGFGERRVVRRYALRNALAPSVQVLAQNLQYLVGGIIVVEYLYAYPGLGKELVDAVAIRDVREVQSIAILIAAVYITINIVADLLVVLLVPRLRTSL